MGIFDLTRCYFFDPEKEKKEKFGILGRNFTDQEVADPTRVKILKIKAWLFKHKSKNKPTVLHNININGDYP